MVFARSLHDARHERLSEARLGLGEVQPIAVLFTTKQLDP